LPGLELSDQEDNDSDIDIESGLSNKRKRKALFGKDDSNDLDKFYENIENPEDENDENELELDAEETDDDNQKSDDDVDNENPLITDLETMDKEEKRKLQATSWFSKVCKKPRDHILYSIHSKTLKYSRQPLDFWKTKILMRKF
jgi:hypothetical protein